MLRGEMLEQRPGCLTGQAELPVARAGGAEEPTLAQRRVEGGPLDTLLLLALGDSAQSRCLEKKCCSPLG